MHLLSSRSFATQAIRLARACFCAERSSERRLVRILVSFCDMRASICIAALYLCCQVALSFVRVSSVLLAEEGSLRLPFHAIEVHFSVACYMFDMRD
jgi:hypothetical protein